MFQWLWKFLCKLNIHIDTIEFHIQPDGMASYLGDTGYRQICKLCGAKEQELRILGISKWYPDGKLTPKQLKSYLNRTKWNDTETKIRSFGDRVESL